MDYKKLQNGSDIRGVALEGIDGEIVNLTSEVVYTIGKAFVAWLRQSGKTAISIAVGMDSRLSGQALKEAFAHGITEMGADVVDCGIASTPAMFMATVDEKLHATAGVMLTASHLPYNRNGLKFFTSNGGLDKKDITAILEIAAAGQFENFSKKGNVTTKPFIDDYSDFLVSYIRKGANNISDYNQPLRGLKIIVDAGNGAGGFFAEKVLAQLGADISGSQFLNPDGRFPNHIPNPEDETAMRSICDAVKIHHADLGIIFDTDVDRSAVVDKNGNPINRNSLIALISAVILNEHPGSTIVTDSITSDGLTKFIEQDLKGKHHRFKRGYKNVINESIRLNESGEESWLAIETSGHAALRENYFLDDGAYLVAKLLVEMARMNAQGLELTQLIENLEQPVESKEYRLHITEPDFANYGNQVLEKMMTKVGMYNGWEIIKPNFEGLRVRSTITGENGWFLLRMSLHDPVMPLNIESNTVGGVSKIRQKLNQIMSGFTGLDITSIL